MPHSLPTIAIISLGGTIAMTNTAAGGTVAPSLNADDLIASVPGLDGIANIQARSFCNRPSVDLGFDDLTRLAEELSTLQQSVDGVVLTQGTDTVEETAWALDLLLATDMPVVMTGAMRNPTVPGADGPANLLAATQVAASPAARDLGVLVVFNDEIHAARLVNKSSTSLPSTFTSPGHGPLGTVTEGLVAIRLRCDRRPALTVDSTERPPDVAIFKPGINESGRLVDAALSAGYLGLVIDGAGGGHVSAKLADVLKHANQRVPVVLCSRTGSGRVLAKTYGFAGSETDLLQAGIVPAGFLSSVKARVLLTLLIGQAATREQIATQFHLYGQ